MALTGTYRKTNPNRRSNIPLDEYYAQQKQRSGWTALKVGKFQLPLGGVKSWIIYACLGVCVITLLGLASNYEHHITCSKLYVEVHSAPDHAFLSKEDVKMLVEMDYGRELKGERLSDIDLYTVEQGLLELPSVSKAEAYKSITGVLSLQVWMRSPIARIVNNSGSYLYIDEKGNKFPTSSNRTAHVPLLRGDIEEKLMPTDTLQKEVFREALPVLVYIHRHDLWRALISEIVVKENGDIILYPQIGDTEIELGKPSDIEDKFQRLMLFYDQVIRQIGWSHYRYVSVKYKNQVVTRKK